MNDLANAKSPTSSTVRSLAQLLDQQPIAMPSLVEPGLLPAQGILFLGGEPKLGKSLLVANLALSLAAGADRLGFPIPSARRVLICQFELPLPQFVSRLSLMRRTLGPAADDHLFVDTRSTGHLLSTPQGLNHFLSAAQAAAAEARPGSGRAPQRPAAQPGARRTCHPVALRRRQRFLCALA